MKWKNQKFTFPILIILISLILISNVNCPSILYSGSFNLYLNQNDSIGSQLLKYYVVIQYLNATPINTTANIYGIHSNDLYSSKLRFTTNTNGEMQILTNLNETKNHIIKVSVNNDETLMANQGVFSFLNGDNIIIYYEVSGVIITETEINAILGLIGIGLFCANPIMSYILTDKAKDKFHFLFVLIGIGIISLGLIFSFIYGS